MRSIFDLKKLLLVALMLCSFRMMAQQAETNPKLKALRNEKNPAVRQKKINALKNGSVEDLELLIQYYEKSPAQQDVVVKSLLKKYPQTENAMVLRFKSFMSVSGAPEMEALLQSMIKAYPNVNLDLEKNLVVMAYAGISDTSKALSLINNMEDPVIKVSAIIQLIETIVASDNAEALVLAKNELGRAKAIKGQPALSGSLELDPKAVYYNYINLYGKLLLKADQTDEAYAFIAEAYHHIENKDAELIENYGFLSSLNGKYEEALPILANVVREGKFEPRYIEELKKGYEKLNPGKDVHAYVDALKGHFIAKIRDQVSKLLISETAPDFVLKDVNGKRVSLSDFKGKTIVLDFWATWCHPCIESFPAMQMAVDRYRKDEQVKFLFIHTWEYAPDPLKDAKNFLSKHHYDFDLYIDPKGKSPRHTAVTDAYKITGIPAKFIIDGKGKIRFKVDGFEGETEVAAEEVVQMIEMARKGV